MASWIYIALVFRVLGAFYMQYLINPHIAWKCGMQVMFVIIFSLVQSPWLEEGPVMLNSVALCGKALETGYHFYSSACSLTLCLSFYYWEGVCCLTLK